jgi:hypothetical protein
MGIIDSHVQFTLRLPEELKESLTKLAKKNHRSLNSEMIVILTQGSAREEGGREKETSDTADKQ